MRAGAGAQVVRTGEEVAEESGQTAGAELGRGALVNAELFVAAQLAEIESAGRRVGRGLAAASAAVAAGVRHGRVVGVRWQEAGRGGRVGGTVGEAARGMAGRAER